MPDFSQSPKNLDPPTVVDHVLLPVADLDEGARRIRERHGLQAIPGGWDVVAPRLRLRNAAGEQSLDGLEFRNANGIALAGPRIDAGILLSIAMLSDWVPARLRVWMAPIVCAASTSAGSCSRIIGERMISVWVTSAPMRNPWSVIWMPRRSSAREISTTTWGLAI